MEQKFITAKGIRFHYRELGTGKTIVLLHPSPRTSKMFEPFGKMVAKHFRVIIPDLPGFGLSEAIPTQVNTLYDVVPYFKAFFDALELKDFGLFGSATGAQLGIAYSLTYPEDVGHLFLDNCANFSEVEYESIVSQYFIDISPKADGSHLTVLWNHIKDSLMYFPWYERNAEYQFAILPPPPEVINDALKDYLQAGPRYVELYKAAFLHERVEKVQALTIPTTLFRWKGSILLKWIDELLCHSLPTNISVVETEKPILERYEEILREFLLA